MSVGYMRVEHSPWYILLIMILSLPPVPNIKISGWKLQSYDQMSWNPENLSTLFVLISLCAEIIDLCISIITLSKTFASTKWLCQPFVNTALISDYSL